MRISKRTVESVSPDTKDLVVWDDKLPGFGLRVKPSGVRSYIVQYRNSYGHSKRVTIGRHMPMTAEQARDRAVAILSSARLGHDEATARRDKRIAPTISDLCSLYMKEHARQHKRAASIAADERNIRNHVVPLLGTLKVAEVSRPDIDRFKRAVSSGKTAKREHVGPGKVILVKGGPGAANRCMALLSKMFNLAERWGLRPDGSNPCRHVEKFRETKCDRFLSDQELASLAAALREAELSKTERTTALAAIRLLLFTGARLSEILTLKWDHVDLQRCRLNIPDSKTGAKTIYLAPPALEVLQSRSRTDGNPYVLPADGKKRYLVNLQKPWRRIRKRATVWLWQNSEGPISEMVAELSHALGRPASYDECLRAAEEREISLPLGLSDVRIHDLRHSFASIAVAGGLSLPVIGALLGHSQPATTARYAHMADDPLRKAAALAGNRIAGAMGGPREPNVTRRADVG